MGGKNKHIKANIAALAATGQIHIASPADNEVRFSFKHLNTGHAKFSYSKRDAVYFLTLLTRLKEVCSLTHKQLVTTHKDFFRCHDHVWAKTSEPNGFGFKGQLADAPGWQFQLTSNAHGRVHGFFIANTFYVVWLDPEHKLYP